MRFLLKEDGELALKRHEAFWERAVIDRPPVMFAFQKAGVKPFPEKKYDNWKARWTDVDYRAEKMDYEVSSTDYLYDALPVVWPNMGPEIFSAWCGCGYQFGETTTWSEPLIQDWERDARRARLRMEHPLFRLLVRFTRLLIERGRGRFIVGLTDLHPGGDHLAALRDPMELNIDMIENGEWVEWMLRRSMPEYYAAYGVFYHMLREADMPITSWTPIAHDGTFYIPSNDFSCMISSEMFEKYFLPGIREECAFYERSIYHLDGPNALRHLDLLLEIPELDAIQWIAGAGNEGFARWREVYRRIQRAGKGIQMICQASELNDIFASLRPEGIIFTSISGVPDRETAAEVVRRIEKWS